MWGIKGPILLDPNLELADALGVRGVPTNVVVDSGGTIRASVPPGSRSSSRRSTTCTGASRTRSVVAFALVADADDRAGHRRVREHEVEGSPGHVAAAAGAQRIVRLLDIQLGEGMPAPEVVRWKNLDREAVGEEPAPERRPDDHAELVLLRAREQCLLVVAGERRVLELERRNGADRERALHQLGRMVREAAVAYLPFRDELLQRAPGLLDRHAPVDVVELQKVEPLTTEPAQTLLATAPDRLGAEIHEVVAVVAAQGAALGEDEHVVAAGERAADDLLGMPPTVEGSGIDPVDTAVHRSVDGPHGVAVVLRAPVDPPLSRPRPDGRGADADTRDEQVARAEATPIHDEEQRG